MTSFKPSDNVGCLSMPCAPSIVPSRQRMKTIRIGLSVTFLLVLHWDYFLQYCINFNSIIVFRNYAVLVFYSLLHCVFYFTHIQSCSDTVLGYITTLKSSTGINKPTKNKDTALHLSKFNA